MAQLCDKAAVSTQDQLVEDIGDWIDQYNLASVIIDAIREQYGSATLEQAKDFWYRALEFHLPEIFEHIARTLPDFDYEQ